jgi:hypothetical protein
MAMAKTPSEKASILEVSDAFWLPFLSEVFRVFVERHAEKIPDPAGPTITILLVKGNRPLERLSGIQGHASASTRLQFGFSGFEQLLRYSVTLPQATNRHSPDVSLAIVYAIAGDGPDHGVAANSGHKDRHGAQTLAERFGGQHGIEKTLGCVSFAIRLKCVP